jgi:hypothetical protein
MKMKIKLLLLINIFFFILIYGSGLVGGRTGVTTWGPTLDFWSMSVAISKNVYNLKGYLGYREVNQVFAKNLTTSNSDIAVNDDGTRIILQDKRLLERTLHEAISIDKKTLKDGNAWTAHYVSIIGEDVGYSDFYAYSFYIFGYNYDSTVRFFILILILSSILFLIQFRDSKHLIFLNILLLAFILVVNSNIIGKINDLMPSIASNRNLTTLGLIPFFHIMLILFNKIKVNYFVVLSQILILILSCHFRSAGIWKIYCIYFIGFSWFLLNKKTVFESINNLKINNSRLYILKFLSLDKFKIILITVLLLFVHVIFQINLKFKLHDIYSTEDVTPNHMIWHNAFIGLSLHPEWENKMPREELRGRGGDGIPLTLSTLILAEKGIPNIGGAAGNLYKIKLHENIIRYELFKFIKNNPMYALQLYLYYKPIAIANTVFNSLITINKKLILLSLLFLTLISLSFIKIRENNNNSLNIINFNKDNILIFTCIAIFTLSPNLWAYPNVFVISDQIILFLFVISILLFMIISKLMLIMRIKMTII